MAVVGLTLLGRVGGVTWTTCGGCGGTGMLVKVVADGGECAECAGSGKEQGVMPHVTLSHCRRRSASAKQV